MLVMLLGCYMVVKVQDFCRCLGQFQSSEGTEHYLWKDNTNCTSKTTEKVYKSQPDARSNAGTLGTTTDYKTPPVDAGTCITDGEHRSQNATTETDD